MQARCSGGVPRPLWRQQHHERDASLDFFPFVLGAHGGFGGEAKRLWSLLVWLKHAMFVVIWRFRLKRDGLFMRMHNLD